MSSPGASSAANPLSGDGAGQPGAWPADRVSQWSDESWWQRQIDAAITGDPVLSNLRITLVHAELSRALAGLTGAGSGANFHTWAVWGSKTAGRTIRREDLPFSPPRALAIGLAVGIAGASAGLRRRVSRRTGLTIGTGGAAGALMACAAGHLVTRAANEIFGGNATVLDDIGRQTARFVSALAHDDGAEPRVTTFLAGLRPGPATDGGQELLRGAYRHYFDARGETDPDRRDELMLCANLLAILHEHQRLEPYIDASVPPACGGS